MLAKNYRLLVYFLFLGKSLEELYIASCVFKYFLGNRISTPCQSGFPPGDSSIDQ